MKIDWSLLIIGVAVIINSILLVIVIKKSKGTKSLIILMSILAPAIILDIVIGLVFGMILVIPLIPIFLFAMFVTIYSFIYFIKCNVKPEINLIKASNNLISSEIIQIDISRKLLQISNFSSIINFIWFAPLMFLLFKWSTITTLMMSIASDNEPVKAKLFVGVVNFIRTGGPLIVVLFVLLISILCIILVMIYILTINGTIRYLRIHGGIKNNTKFLILMLIPVEIYLAIYLLVIKQK